MKPSLPFVLFDWIPLWRTFSLLLSRSKKRASNCYSHLTSVWWSGLDENRLQRTSLFKNSSFGWLCEKTEIRMNRFYFSRRRFVRPRSSIWQARHPIRMALLPGLISIRPEEEIQYRELSRLSKGYADGNILDRKNGILGRGVKSRISPTKSRRGWIWGQYGMASCMMNFFEIKSPSLPEMEAEVPGNFWMAIKLCHLVAKPIEVYQKGPLKQQENHFL